MENAISVRKKPISRPTDEFLNFLKIVNDYRGYEAFEGFINEALIANREALLIERKVKQVTPKISRLMFMRTFEQFDCPPFKKHFLLGKEPHEMEQAEPIQAVMRYEDFYSNKSLFIETVLSVEYLRTTETFPMEVDWMFNFGKIPAHFFIDVNGFYKEVLSTKVFYGIDFTRVRLCICGNYFWAFREDKNCCSTKCGNLVRQRKFMADRKKREIYNKNRLEYYHQNKEAVKKRKNKKGANKNGAL
jgi:hypothetical protein